MHIMVLGAGVVGITTAWFLQKEGYQVTVVDRQNRAVRVALVCCVWAFALAKEGDDVKHLTWLESAAMDLPEEPLPK